MSRTRCCCLSLLLLVGLFMPLAATAQTAAPTTARGTPATAEPPLLSAGPMTPPPTLAGPPPLVVPPLPVAPPTSSTSQGGPSAASTAERSAPLATPTPAVVPAPLLPAGTNAAPGSAPALGDSPGTGTSAALLPEAPYRPMAPVPPVPPPTPAAGLPPAPPALLPAAPSSPTTVATAPSVSPPFPPPPPLGLMGAPPPLPPVPALPGQPTAQPGHNLPSSVQLPGPTTTPPEPSTAGIHIRGSRITPATPARLRPPAPPPPPALVPTAPGLPPTVPSHGLLPEAAANLRRFTRAVSALRDLPQNPHSAPLIRQILRIPALATRLVGLVPFPLPHWYQTSPDEIVVRDRSFNAYEYRHFGQFQTRLNGWIRPISTNIHVDLRFDGRGRRDLGLKGVVSRQGPLTGTLHFTGTDRMGRAWTLQIAMEGLLVNDDGYPSGGTLHITGTDPLQRAATRRVTFPQPILEAPLNPRDRRNRRSRQESVPKP